MLAKQHFRFTVHHSATHFLLAYSFVKSLQHVKIRALFQPYILSILHFPLQFQGTLSVIDKFKKSASKRIIPHKPVSKLGQLVNSVCNLCWHLAVKTS